jgi:hypothetical protein
MNNTESKRSGIGVLLLLTGFTIASAALTAYVAGWSSLVLFAIGAPFALWFVGFSLSVPTLDDRYPTPERPRREATPARANEAHAHAGH